MRRLGGAFRRLAPLALALLGLAAPEAWAKKVSLEWKAMPGATKYELQVLNGETAVFKQTLEDTRWKGDLGFGIYSYQLRAIDAAGRGGRWTEARNLVVTPPPPKLEPPAEGNKVELFDPKAPTHLKWAPVEGVKNYALEVMRDGKPVYTGVVNGNEMELPGLGTGDYTWKVAGILQNARNLHTTAAQIKKWLVQADPEGFKVEQKQLEPPRQISPLGSTAPSQDRQRFVWKRVDGAQAYEVSIIRVGALAQGVARSPAAFEKAKKFVVKDTKLELRLSSEGRYAWQVRALANLDAKQVPHAVGPESTADFELDRNAVFKDDAGYIAVSSILAPYTYRLNYYSANVNGNAASSALTIRGSGEWWIRPQWGAGITYDHTFFTIGGINYNRKSWELQARARFKLTSDGYGWMIVPKLGVELREYVVLLPQGGVSSALSGASGYAIGPSAGVDIRRQFSQNLSFGARFNYVLPLGLIGSLPQSTGDLQGGANFRNLSFGLQALYWWTPNIGLGLGGFFELRSISTRSTVSGQTDEVAMDGSYFFGSLVYRFWR